MPNFPPVLVRQPRAFDIVDDPVSPTPQGTLEVFEFSIALYVGFAQHTVAAGKH